MLFQEKQGFKNGTWTLSFFVPHVSLLCWQTVSNEAVIPTEIPTQTFPQIHPCSVQHQSQPTAIPVIEMPKARVKAECSKPSIPQWDWVQLTVPCVTAWGGSGCSDVSRGNSAFLVYAPGTHSSSNTRSRRDGSDVQCPLFPKITFITCMKDNTILN